MLFYLGNFQQSQLGQQILANQLHIPSHDTAINSEYEIPYYFTGDNAFPLAPNLMRPYSDIPPKAENEAFNEKLCYANKTIENTFGVLLSRWRILLRPMNMRPENAKRIILGCVVLHNYLMCNNPDETGYCPNDYTDKASIDCIIQNGIWRSEIDNSAPPIIASSCRNLYGGQTSPKIRNNLRDFLNSYEAISLDC